LYAQINFEAFKVKGETRFQLHNGDLLFVGDQIIFEFNTEVNSKLSLSYKYNNDSFKKLFDSTVNENTTIIFPSNKKALTLDSEQGVLTFQLKTDEEEKEMTFYANPIALETVDKYDDGLFLQNTSKIYIDTQKIISNDRGYKEANVIVPLLEASTVIIKVKNSIGTGTIIENGKYILTNYHVIEPDDNNVYIAFKNNNSNNQDKNVYYKVNVQKIDMSRDLALLQVPLDVDSVQIKSLPLSDLSHLKKGIDIYTMGHPQGYYFAFEYGMLNNMIENYSWKTYKADSVLQYSMNSNRGNSGGPIINEKLELIGIGAFSNTSGNNLNFAISIQDIRKFLLAKDSIRIEKKSLEEYSKDIIDEGLFQNIKLAKLDRNKNGIPDAMMKDVDNDGTWDIIAYDTDEDGSYERVTSF
jgi:S1-C subfamily serine protease